MEPQNPSNSSDVAYRSDMKRGKNYKKKQQKIKEKKRVMRGLAGMTLADHDPKSSEPSYGQTKRSRKLSDSLSFSTNLLQKRGRHDVACGKQGGIKLKKIRLARASQLAMLGL